jgi:flagellar export protein FliJ
MRRFNFRLQRILGYRRSLTEGEKTRFAVKVQALVRAEEDASRLRGVRNQTIVARMSAFREGITSREAANLHEHIVRINEAIGVADVSVESATGAVDIAREKLVERRRDEKAVELLKKRRFQAWERDYYRDEGKTLDDIATIRHARASEKEE